MLFSGNSSRSARCSSFSLSLSRSGCPALLPPRLSLPEPRALCSALSLRCLTFSFFCFFLMPSPWPRRPLPPFWKMSKSSPDRRSSRMCGDDESTEAVDSEKEGDAILAAAGDAIATDDDLPPLLPSHGWLALLRVLLLDCRSTMPCFQ